MMIDVFNPLQPTTTTPPTQSPKPETTPNYPKPETTPNYPKPETTPNYPIYVAKYDYDQRTDDDLGFKKGDLMYIIDTHETGDWWYARLKDNGKEGYIPSNFVAEYRSLETEE